MKRVQVFLCLFSLVLGASAQVRIGVKGGVNLTNTWFENNKVYDVSNRAGFFFGPTALYETSLTGLDFDASLLYDQRGVETETPDLSGGRHYKTISTYRQLILPVNARYNLISGNAVKLYVFAGPQVGFNIGKREYSMDYGDMVFSKVSFSVNAGIGVVLSQHFQVSANYNVICGKSGEVWINRDWGIGQQVNKCRMNAWQFSVGYYF